MSVEIVSITSCQNPAVGGISIFGLGEDNMVYLWSAQQGVWTPAIQVQQAPLAENGKKSPSKKDRNRRRRK